MYDLHNTSSKEEIHDMAIAPTIQFKCLQIIY